MPEACDRIEELEARAVEALRTVKAWAACSDTECLCEDQDFCAWTAADQALCDLARKPQVP